MLNSQYAPVCSWFTGACHLCEARGDGDTTCLLNYCTQDGENVDHPDHERSVNTCEGCYEYIITYVKCKKQETLETCNGRCDNHTHQGCDENFCTSCGIHHECYTRYMWCLCTNRKVDTARVRLIELFNVDPEGPPYSAYNKMRNEIMRFLVWHGEHK